MVINVKNKIILITMLILIIVSMVGCGDNNREIIANDGRSIYAENICNKELLIYDTDTNIVYIKQYTYNGNYIYTLYLSENGLPYKYVNGELIEVGQ